MLEEQRNYTLFETFDDYCRYMAYVCRKNNEYSPNYPHLINWWAIGYSYRKQIMKP